MLETEKRNAKTMHIDKMDTLSILKIINEENLNSVKAVEEAIVSIGNAVDIVAKAIEDGGRLFYVGAGTSGRIAVMDAAECPPTYGVDYDTVIAVIAGGENALCRSAENAEDSAEAGEDDISKYHLTVKDVVMGISAAGSAEYVVAAMRAAKRAGCVTISLSSNAECKIEEIADIHICVKTGAEVVTGSTRMKAGNAQKMVLNMISTCAMIKTGKVYENLMINLKPSNKKLKMRMIGIVQELCNIGYDEALRTLAENEFSIQRVLEEQGMITGG